MNNQNPSIVGGIVLAAGQSSRYGSDNKLLANVNDTPMVVHVAETIAQSSLDDIAAVVGHEHDTVSAHLEPVVDVIQYNDRYAEGQSTSVCSGVELAQQRNWDAAVFCLGDMPFVDTVTIDQLKNTYLSGQSSIVVPRYDGQRGNPVLFDRIHFEALTRLSGDTGGREILTNHDGTRFVDVDDSGVTHDIDTQTE